MGRAKKDPTMVVRLPIDVVEAIDAARGGLGRGEFLRVLLLSGVTVTDIGRSGAESVTSSRGSPSPSLERFKR